MAASVRHKEVIRGKILYYLGLIYPQAATLPLLQGELDIFGYPVPLEELNFHVAYLTEKGLVAMERAPRSRFGNDRKRLNDSVVAEQIGLSHGGGVYFHHAVRGPRHRQEGHSADARQALSRASHPSRPLRRIRRRRGDRGDAGRR